MKLLVIVICLLSERFLIHSMSYQRFNWFEKYAVLVKGFIEKNKLPNSAGFLLSLVVLPITIVVGVVYWLIYSGVWGLFGFIASLALFFYCIGPQNPFYPSTDDHDPNQVSTYFSEVNNQLFAVVFWYVIGGPIIALLFRLISLSQNVEPMAPLAKECTEIMEWIPARIAVLLYLLVGNFQAGIKPYSQLFLTKPTLNTQLLSECSLLAVRYNESDEVSMPAAENLVEHAVLVFLVILALLTLASWL